MSNQYRHNSLSYLSLGLVIMTLQSRVQGYWTDSCSDASWSIIDPHGHIPQGMTMSSDQVQFISDNDELTLKFDSPLITPSSGRPNTHTRSVWLALVPSVDENQNPIETWPTNFASLSSNCTRTFSSPVDLTLIGSTSGQTDFTKPGHHGTTPCLLQYSFIQSWNDVVRDCGSTASSYVTIDGNLWQRTQYHVFARWQDNDLSGTQIFSSSMWWSVTMQMQVESTQSTSANDNVLAPYVNDSFQMLSAIVKKFPDKTVKFQVDYSFKTRWPFKPSLHVPSNHVPLPTNIYNNFKDSIVLPSWSDGSTTWLYGSQSRMLNNLLTAQSCDTGGMEPKGGDHCIQTGSLIYEVITDPDLQITFPNFDPQGAYDLLFDNDCTSWMNPVSSDCSHWPVLGWGTGETGKPSFTVPSLGAQIGSVPVTSNLTVQAIAQPERSSNFFGANARVEFISTYSLPVQATKVTLDELIITQKTSNATYSWTLVSNGVLFPLAVNANLSFTYDGWPDRIDCRATLILLAGDTKETSFITGLDAVGSTQTFSAKMTVHIEFKLLGDLPLMKRDTFPGWAAGLTASHTSNIQVINLANYTAENFTHVEPYIPNSFNIETVSYSKDFASGNTTMYIEYSIGTQFPYMPMESNLTTLNAVLLLPNNTIWDAAKTAGWLRSDWSVAEYTWDTVHYPLIEAPCLTRGWFNFIIPTQNLCDPAGTFEMVWDLKCFQDSPSLCTKSGSLGSPGAFRFTIGAGMDLCAAPSTEYTVATSLVTQGDSPVPAGNSIHLHAEYESQKSFYEIVVMTVTVQEVDGSGQNLENAWNLVQNAAIVTMGTRTGYRESASWSNDTQLKGIKDIYFTPNIGPDKVNYMITLADRDKNPMHFKVTITTRFYFDSMAYTENPPRRLMYRDTVTVTRYEETKASAGFTVTYGNVKSTTPTTVALPIGMAVGGVILISCVIALTVVIVMKGRQLKLSDIEKQERLSPFKAI